MLKLKAEEYNFLRKCVGSVFRLTDKFSFVLYMYGKESNEMFSSFISVQIVAENQLPSSFYVQ